MVAACPHPSGRLFAWTAYDATRCIACCDCGAILTGGTTMTTTPTDAPPWAERIKTLRARRGWTQAECAQRIGCSYQTIQAWEYRQNTAPIPVYRRIIEALEQEDPR